MNVCLGCNWIRSKGSPLDITIQGRPASNTLLTFVDGTGIPLIHDNCLSLLPSKFRGSCWHLGQVFSEDGGVVKGWHTITSLGQYIIRGSRDVALRVCHECGRNCYFALGDRYLSLPALPPGMAGLSDLYGLVFDSERPADAVAKVRGVQVEVLRFLSQPVDGHAELPFYSR